MIVLTVAGKADSRVIVYPVLYMLKNFGRVMVASDDAAYRRLYHGYEDFGEVSGVSVFVHPYLDVEVLSAEVARSEPDFLICITNGYVPSFTTHLLVLTGYDRSFAAGNAHAKTALEQVIDVKLEERDIVAAPVGLSMDNIRELIVSSSPVKSKTVLSVSLKEGLLLHPVKCEEAKELLKYDSRDFVGLLMKVFCPFILPNPSDVLKVFGYKK